MIKSIFYIKPENTINSAIKKINLNSHGCLIVVDNNMRLLGTLSDGDIRKALLKKKKLKDKIQNIFFKKSIFVYRDNYSKNLLKKLILKKNYPIIPVIDKTKKVYDIFYKEKLNINKIKSKNKISTNVVIMAGGKGTRLQPFTNILPKPLIPINGKPVIKHIIDKFEKYGFSNFHLTLNYKAEIMKAYFKEINTKYKLNYIQEKKPLGTVGGLRQLYKKIKNYLIVTNCDTIINANYLNILNYHKKNKFDMTIVASKKKFVIPYGICRTNNKTLKKLEEKPSYSFLANSGFYILNKEILGLIPHNKYYNINQLLDVIKKTKLKVGVFKISDNAWIDTGQWSELNKIQKI
tara:strand:- start:704 stop:1750 length:1047 start_codon:yes stop_codon:yes gene_type:complete